MNFFEHQQEARRNTRVMVLMYVLAVTGIVFAVDLVVASIWFWSSDGIAALGNAQPGLIGAFRSVPAGVHVFGVLATLTVILGASFAQMAKLREGGETIAKMIGARHVEPTTRDPLERRLLNVVEEMAIAAGTRVPKVFVMDKESGINAFAAGYDISNTVVAVTRGTLETLNRDELQGVIGHEFSHILNGDMALNIRMMGVLAGIVFISSIGGFMMRLMSEGGDNKAVFALFLVGLSLFVTGYVGLFFARLIKSSVSRQREFLADASSVQFTRNPDGIAGALDQIRAAPAGALIAGRYAEEISHMFFGQAIRVWFGGLFDTHPPLEERIRRVNPRFAASAYRTRRAAAPAPAMEAPPEAVAAGFAGVAPAGRRTGDAGIAWGRSAGQSAQLVGTLQNSNIDYAARLLAALPSALRESLREAEGAAAAVIALLLAPAEEVRREQLRAINAAGMAALGERVARAADLTRDLGPAFHLAVVDLALPALKAAPEPAKQQLIGALEAVINADRRVSLHEFVVLTLLRHQLASRGKAEPAGRRLADMQPEIGIVLSLIAHAGIRADATGARGDALQAAMRAGTQEMGLPDQPPAAALSLEAASAALASLKRLAPLQKAMLIKGLFATVSADGTIRVIEAELMRLVGAVLDCPLPPLLEEVDPATLAA